MKYEEALKLIKEKVPDSTLSFNFTPYRDLSVGESIANWLVKLGIIEKSEEKLYYIKVTEGLDGYLNLDIGDETFFLGDGWNGEGFKTKFTLEEIKENPLLAPFIDKAVPVEDAG